MPIFNVWDVVKAPFPYADRPVRQWRPALVVAVVDARDLEPLGVLPVADQSAVAARLSAHLAAALNV